MIHTAHRSQATNETSARSAYRATRLRNLAVQAYWAAKTPTEAKMASILLCLFAPDVQRAADGYHYMSGA